MGDSVKGIFNLTGVTGRSRDCMMTDSGEVSLRMPGVGKS